MATELFPDICIIGAGSAGLTAAAAAAAFGADVVLIEKAEMGGDCLHRGCVPSKALIAAAARAHAYRSSRAFGIGAVEPEIDFSQLRQHIAEVISTIAPNDSEARFASLGVKVIRAQARFADRRTVVAAAWRIRARRYVIAAGSRPAIPPIPGLDEVGYLTSDTIFSLARRPQHLAIIGGGPVGLEMAQAWRRLGSDVTVLDAGPLLAGFDPEIVRIARTSLRAEGIRLHEHCRIDRADPHEAGGVRLQIGAGDETWHVGCSDVLVAAGREPNLAGLGLEAASIAFGPRGIRVDSRLRTTNRRAYAIGDVAEGGNATHLAGHQAGLVIRSILFRSGGRFDPDIIPRTVFLDPEIAEVGLREEEARRRHGRISVLRWPLAENDRAVAERRASGLLRILADRGGRILGVSIIGPHATELIAPWSMAVARSMKLRQMLDHVLPYPTYGEAGKRAAIAYYSPYARKPLIRRLVRFLRLFG